MKPTEIDRLFAYRNKNLFVNSAKEFQAITKVSDSLLEKLAPHFKFPKWVEQMNKQKKKKKRLDILKQQNIKKRCFDFERFDISDFLKVERVFKKHNIN